MLRKFLGYNLALKPLKENKLPRKEKLLNILEYCNRNIPFYKGKYSFFLESACNLPEEDFYYAFSHLPITQKSDIKAKNSAFKSVTLDYKYDILKNGKTPSAKEVINHGIVKRDFFASISTGGSSGIPAFRWLDYDDANLFAQSFLKSFRINGWSPGEDFVVFYPLKSYFTGPYADQSKALRTFFGFTMVPFETVNKESVTKLLETLKNTKATLLVIFPCVLQRVAEIMKEEGIEPLENLPYINVSGEFLLDCSKSFIQEQFPDSDIQSTYGAVEFGEIAHQKDLRSFDYDVFNDYVYVEQGPENTILVTSYYQRAFPIIRYRIEDTGKVVNHKDGSQSILNLEGKNTDYVTGAGGYMYYASFFNSVINEINKALNDPIIHFTLRHDGEKVMQLNFVLHPDKQDKKKTVKQAAQNALSSAFLNFETIEITFKKHFDHDYTRKFKIIGEGDGLSEVVGGYYQRKAS
ncbi:MAG: hypothetical protein OEY94_01995 [Alphaproteobacteria bacterium]|nr:hypothetical protein [Alphaproteobacteria bacterium]